MTDTGALRGAAARDAAYETTLALHALATLTSRSDDNRPARASQLVRYVVSRTDLLNEGAHLPAAALRYFPDDRPTGFGALLAEDLEPGSTGLADELAALRDADLIDPLYAFVSRAEEVFGPSWTDGAAERLSLGRTVPGAVHMLMSPVPGWSMVAMVTAKFSFSRVQAADTTPQQPVGATSSSWSALSGNALAESDRALHQARHLTDRLGHPQPPRALAEFDSPNVWSPSTFSDGACAGAVALTYLAEQAQLPSPAEMGVFVVADISPEGAWRASPERARAAEAARAVDLRVLAYTERGWTLDGSTAGTGLDDAAELLWGQAWHRAQERWHEQRMLAQGWSVVHASPTETFSAETTWPRDGDEPPLVEAPHVEVIENNFLVQSQLGLILGGPPNSGKSVIARQLTERLESRNWKVLALSPADHGLPPDGDLPLLVRAAMGRTGIPSGERTLVIIEDLHPLGRQALGRAVSSVVSELEVRVLALARYSNDSVINWESEDVSPVPAVVGLEEVAQLARSMIDQHPSVYAGASEAVPFLADMCNNDLWLLSRLMVDVSSRPETYKPGSADNLLRERIQRLLVDIPDEHRDTLELIAALSLFGEPLARDQLPEGVSSTLSLLGVRLDGPLVQLPSRRYASALLQELSPHYQDAAGRRDMTAAIQRPIVPHLLRLLSSGDSRRILGLLRVFRAYDPHFLEQLVGLDEVRSGFTAWTADGDVISAASALTICESADPQWVATLLPDVVRRTPQAQDLTARELSKALRLISRHHHRLHQTDELDRFVAWLAEPESGLAMVLGKPTTMTDRFYLARNVFRLYHSSTPDLLLARQEELLQQIDPTRTEDLVCVRKLDILLARCRRESTNDQYEHPAGRRFRPLESEQQVQDLLEGRPPRSTKLGVLVAWLSLRLHFDRSVIDWDELISAHQAQLASALRNSTAPEITLALADLADNHRGFCTKLLNTLRPTDQLRSVLRGATPAAAALLLSTLARIHSATTRHLLYKESGGELTADAVLAKSFANRIVSLKDAKGAGMLLSTTHRIDELYCWTKGSFAGKLVELLGREFTTNLVEHEKRPAILYYFLRGIWEARASYREEVRESALQLIVRSLNSGVSRPWAAQLALLLADDDYFGEDFLVRLAAELEPRSVARRMAQSITSTANLVHLHHLGRALGPQVLESYRSAFKLPKALVNKRPEEVAQRLRVTVDTLTMSGVTEANARILQAFHETSPEWDWEAELGRSRSIGDLYRTLDNLYKLDPGTATLAVHGLNAIPQGESYSVLADFVLRSAGDPHEVTELLRAVHRIEPEIGQDLLRTLRTRGHSWNAFTNELKYEQDPSSQGRIGRHLAYLGVVPGPGNLPWMRELVEEKWCNVAHLLASPRAVTELLKLAFIWDQQWGDRLSGSIDADKVMNRVRLGAVDDLREVPGLLHILSLLGHRGLTEELAERVTAFSDHDQLVRTMGLRSSAHLLQQLHLVGSPRTRSIGEATARRLDAARGRHLVIHPDAYWSSMGWTAQTLRDVGLGSLLSDEPPILDANTDAFAAELCWAATWLPESEWTRDVLERALPVVQRTARSWKHSDQLAITLIAGVRAGKLTGLAEDGTFWRPVANASIPLLALAHREAQDHPAMEKLLTTLKPTIRTRLKSRVHQVNPWLGELQSLMSRLPEPPAAPAASDLFGSGGPFGSG